MSSKVSSTGKVSFRTVLLLPYLGFSLAVCIIVFVFLFVEIEHTVDQMAQDLLHEVSLRTVLQVGKLMEGPVMATNLNHQTVSYDQVSLEDSQALQRVFARTLSHHPVSLTYVGIDSKAYIGARRTNEGRITVSFSDESTAFTNRRFLSNSAGVRRELIQKGEKPYNPTARPWYKAAVEKGKMTWSEIYPDFNSKVLGITISRPLFDAKGVLRAVFATDFLLDQLEEMIQKIEVGESGFVYLTDGKGFLISSSLEGESLFLSDGQNDQRVSAKDSGNLLLRESFQTMAIQETENVVAIQTSQGKVWAVRSSIQDAHGLNWDLFTILPQSDFLGVLHEGYLKAAAFLAVLFLLSVLFLVRVSHRLSRPLMHLAAFTSRVRAFELEEKLDLKTNVRELVDLEDNVNSMTGALRSFSRYVPKSLVRFLVKESLESVSVEKKNLVLMFSDIEGYTSASEILPANELVQRLNAYLEELSKLVRAYGGTIDKYIGDAVMAFWGAPVSLSEQDPVKAVECALECIDEVEALNTKFARDGGPVFRTRIGLALGECVVGDVGSSLRVNYTALGDPVNLAARLEGLNKSFRTSILIDPEMAAKVKDSVFVRSLGFFDVKGKKDTVEVFEVLGFLEKANHKKEQLQSYEKACDFLSKASWEEAAEEFDKSHWREKDEVVDFYLNFCRKAQELGLSASKDWKSVSKIQEFLANNP